MKFAEHFTKIIVINLRRRRDRLAHFLDQMDSIGVSVADITVFEGYDKPELQGVPNGNLGCTASHRGVLELIAFNRWERVCVFEDDATVRAAYAPNFDVHFEHAFLDVPQDFDICYLGAHYANDPIRKVTARVVECSRVLTTSSYVIGWKQARKMAPHISGVGPIDNLFGDFTAKGGSYVLFPRLFVQYTNQSDLTGQMAENTTCMEDKSHEQVLGLF